MESLSRPLYKGAMKPDNSGLYWNIILLALLWMVLSPSIGPGPGPNPGPAPIPEPGFRVLVVEETELRSKLPVGQLNALTSTLWKKYCDEHCIKGPDNLTPEWRVYDTNDDLSNESQLWQEAFARPRTSLPWLLVSNGKTGTESPFPENVESVLTILKSHTP